MFQVIAAHIDIFKYLLTFAYKRRASYRLIYSAVADNERLICGKIEITCRCINGSPPSCVQYRPYSVLDIISDGVDVPLQIYVLLMRDVGA